MKNTTSEVLASIHPDAVKNLEKVSDADVARALVQARGFFGLSLRNLDFYNAIDEAEKAFGTGHLLPYNYARYLVRDFVYSKENRQKRLSAADQINHSDQMKHYLTVLGLIDELIRALRANRLSGLASSSLAC